MLKIQKTKTGFLVAKGNTNFSCPAILTHSNNDFCLGSCSMTDSSEELFESFLNTVSVSVNTELPMDFYE